jgi:TRAP-type C4-dicarboxylate transport system permease small subunit
MAGSLVRALNRLVDALAVLTFTGMFLCVLVQVILRYGFDRPLVWSDELARYLFVWCAFLGWIVASRRRSHLAITVVADRFGPRAQAAFALVSALATLAFCAVLGWYGVQITRRNVDIDTVALFFTFAAVYAIVPIAAVAVGLQALADVRSAWSRLSAAKAAA